MGEVPAPADSLFDGSRAVCVLNLQFRDHNVGNTAKPFKSWRNPSEIDESDVGPFEVSGQLPVANSAHGHSNADRCHLANQTLLRVSRVNMVRSQNHRTTVSGVGLDKLLVHATVILSCTRRQKETLEIGWMGV